MRFENVRPQKLRYGLPFQCLYAVAWGLQQTKAIISLVFEFIGLVRLISNWYAPLFVRFSPFAARDTEAEIRMRNGLEYIICPKRGELSILNEVLYHSIYERQFPIRGTVVDVGAHVGIFAVYAGARSDTVICYEAHDANYARTLRNVRLNSLPNVLAFQQAIGGSRAMRKLSLHATTSYGHTLYPEDDYNGADTMMVKTITLEDIFSSNRLQHVNTLKLHCEGAEYEILANASQAVLEKIDTIVIKHSGYNCTELGTFLNARGFEVKYGDRDMIYATREGR